MNVIEKQLKADFLTQSLTQKESFVTVKFNFYLRHYKRHSDGKSQVYINITCGKTRKRIKTDVFVNEKFWNKRKQRPNHKLVNESLILDNYRQRLNSIIINYKLKGQTLSLQKLLEEYFSTFSRVDYVAFFENLLENDKSITSSTLKKERAVLSKIKSFRKEILFCDIDENLISKYVKYLVTKRKNNMNTAMSNLKTFKKYLKKAQKYGIEFPVDLDDIKVKHIESLRTNLSIDELKKCYDFYFTDISDRYKYVLGYFLFSCFTGLRSSDLKNLTRDQIKEEHFVITVLKTGRTLNMFMSKKAIMIVKECPDLFEKKVTHEYINRELKVIMNMLGIKKRVSLHVGRHTFAANYCRMNGNIVDLKNLLGHKNIKVTMMYSKIPYEESSKNIYIIDDIFNQKGE